MDIYAIFDITCKHDFLTRIVIIIMYTRSRRGTTESGEEARKMSLLRSIVDQESDTTYDAKPTDDDQNSFDVTRSVHSVHSD